MGEPSRRTTISAALHPSGLYGKSGQAEATPQLKAHDSLLGVCQKAPKYSQTMRNKILWSDVTKIELFGLNTKRHIWRKPGPIRMVKHGGGRIMVWGCFFSGRDW